MSPGNGRRPNVAHVITTLTTGGAERQLELLMNRTTARTTVVALYGGGPVADSLRSAGHTVHVLGMGGAAKVLTWFRLALLLRRLRPDVVHVHLLAAQLWGIPAARLARIPVVISSEHSLMADSIEGRPLTAPLRLVYRMLERLSTRTVAVSATTADRLARWGVARSRITVVDNGIDFDSLTWSPDAAESARREWDAAPDTVVIGVVGRLDPVKRIDQVVRAVAPRLRAGGHLLVIVGVGPLEDDLRRLTRELHVQDAVRLTGARPDVARLLSGFDLLVSASRDETFGMAVVEAVGNGLPVVFAECPALEELPEPPPGAVRIGPSSDGDDVQALAAAVDDVVATVDGQRLPVPPALVARYGANRAAQGVDAVYRRELERTTASADAIPGLALASRGDALTPFLFRELLRRYPGTGVVDADLTALQRLVVAGTTFRPTRAAWAELFFKSSLGYRLRSRNVGRSLRQLGAAESPVLQVHALFRSPGAPTLLYVDCTLDQAVESWPAWAPMHGSAVRSWREEEQASYRDAEHIFAFTTTVRDSLLAGYGVRPERVSVVGAGVNVDELPPLPAPSTQPPTILFIGNDFTRKGGHDLIDAFRTVRRSVPDARLVLVGRAPGIRPEPGVEVCGRVHDRTEIARLYASSTVFCLPTRFDPFPLVLLEAMAHALPVVTTRLDGILEMITADVEGVTVEPGDTAELAAILITLLTDPRLAEKIGLAGRQRVERDWTWEKVVNRMAPELDRVLGS